MRRGFLFLVLLLVTPILSSQSVTISQDKLDELTQILSDYMQITEKLAISSTNSERRTDALQSGFEAYKATVDQRLIPLTDKLVKDYKVLSGVTIVACVVIVFEAILLLFK